MGRVRRKRVHKNIKDGKKKFRLRRRTKDIDQVHDELQKVDSSGQDGDMIMDSKAALLQEIDPSLPGGGQFYCAQCSRYFIADKAYREHLKSKPHKKRLRLLKETPYSQKEAEMAAGMGSYTVNPKLPRLVGKTEQKDENMDTQVDDLVSAMQGAAAVQP